MQVHAVYSVGCKDGRAGGKEMPHTEPLASEQQVGEVGDGERAAGGGSAATASAPVGERPSADLRWHESTARGTSLPSAGGDRLLLERQGSSRS